MRRKSGRSAAPGRFVVVAGALALVVSACSADSGVSQELSRPSDTGAEPTTPAETDPPATEPDDTEPADPTTTLEPVPGEFQPAPLAWEDFFDGAQVATLDVPIDYDDPEGPTLELFIARHPASGERIGSLLVNPGGPGFGGSDFAFFAEQIFDEELLERFDIIGWDPRGTGESDPAIDCIEEYDPFFAVPDITPDTEDERQQNIALAGEFAGECVRNNGEIVEHVGTNASARDIDTIRRALGEETISYFGFSYGSELGATWATLFPQTVRAAVLDGASDPEADDIESSIQQLRGFEGTLTTFLAQCSADDDCAFHNDGNAEGAFDALMASLDETPVPSQPGRPDVNRGVATTGVVQAMYSPSFWPALEQALADAQAGDGSGLLALYDSYYQRNPDGSYGNELEAFQVISCADSAERRTVEEEEATVPLFTEAAPRLAPPGSSPGFFCTFFPPALDPRVDITGAGAGPIVVIGTTGDPATPLESTEAMAATLEEGRLVIVEADQHTGYNVNRCVNEVVNRYLVDLQPPESGTECR